MVSIATSEKCPVPGASGHMQVEHYFNSTTVHYFIRLDYSPDNNVKLPV